MIYIEFIKAKFRVKSLNFGLFKSFYNGGQFENHAFENYL